MKHAHFLNLTTHFAKITGIASAEEKNVSLAAPAASQSCLRALEGGVLA